MRQPFFLLLGLLLFLGCEKVELPDTNKKKQAETSEAEGILSVAEAQQRTNIYAWVQGYIVGAVNGTTLTQATFSPPFTKTNLLLADNATETEINKCFPVFLTDNGLRDVLNLADNPQRQYKAIRVYGLLTKYFGVQGIKKIEECAIDTTSNPQDPDTGIKYDSIPLPHIDSTTTGVIDGRSLIFQEKKRR